MARITVEDCIDKFPSRFELVLVAANRARKLHSGEEPTLERDNDKNTVIALREISQQSITTDQLKNDLILEYQTSTFEEDTDLNENEEIAQDETSNEEGSSIDDKLIEDQNINLTEDKKNSEDLLNNNSDDNLDNEQISSNPVSENLGDLEN